ncbi:Visinin-like protein 1 [Astathelohania contejeani]|uniref:Visinin-like protein 1 n=1 Tax=Astathelohania contejeani TaxID=164912 RepID=A0ABQ7I0I8_9MICR|nr:Visinin-like protein 1 [Thelohania contejeani]
MKIVSRNKLYLSCLKSQTKYFINQFKINSMGAIRSRAVSNDDDIIKKFPHFTPEDVIKWTQSFHCIYPKGYMNKDELNQLFQTFFPFGNPSRFTANLFRTVNISGNNKIDLNEILIAFSILSKGSMFEKLRWIFRFYDSDNDGVVSKMEIRNIVEALYEMVGPTFDLTIDVKAAVDEIFCELENESGFLTFDDFKRLAQSENSAFKTIALIN